MASPYIGSILLFGGNYNPRGYALCQGQIMSIAQNTALFSILGTTYGGDGVSTFGLPDLQGRVAVGAGSGPGLPNIVLGQVAGEASHTLAGGEIPQHVHPLNPGANSTNSNPNAVKSPQSAFPGYSDAAPLYAPVANTTLATSNSGIAGSSVPHNNMQPYLGMNFIIALEGIFPPRN